MSKAEPLQMQIPVNHILLRALPETARRRNARDFPDQVAGYVRGLFDEIGGLIVAMVAGSKSGVSVTWQPDASGPGPLAGIIRMLEHGRSFDAILLLELFRSARSDDPVILYNLGLAYSDASEMERALTCLRRLLGLEPGNVNGRIALGVALMRQGQSRPALAEFQRAVQDDPENPVAQRNLGRCLYHLGQIDESLEPLRRATELAPDDLPAWLGLGQSYEKLDRLTEADAAYVRLLEIDELGEPAAVAKEGRSRIAAANFRSNAPNMLRMDAVMGCLSALQMFEKMPLDQVKQIGLEVAYLGMSGIDVNNPDTRYTLRSLPGDYSGLHLLCLEYVSFKQFAPETDIGFDLAREYEVASHMYHQERNDKA